MATQCGCNVVFRSDLLEYECDFRVASFTSSGEDDGLKIFTVHVLDIGVANSSNTINLLQKATTISQSKILLSVCDIRRHNIPRSASSTSEAPKPQGQDFDLLASCSKFFRKIFLSGSLALCQISGNRPGAGIFTEYALLTVIGGFQGVLYTSSQIQNIWKDHKVLSIVPKKTHTKEATSPPASATLKTKSLSKPVEKSVTSSAGLTRAPSLQFKSTADHRKCLEDLHHLEYSKLERPDSSLLKTVVKAYVPPDHSTSSDHGRVAASYPTSQQSTASTSAIKYEENIDAFDLLVSSSQGSLDDNGNSNSNSSQSTSKSKAEEASILSSSRKRSRSIYEDDEDSLLFPQLQSASNLLPALSSLEPSSNSNFFALSANGEESYLTRDNIACASSSSLIPPSSFLSPGNSRGLFSFVTNAVSYMGSMLLSSSQSNKTTTVNSSSNHVTSTASAVITHSIAQSKEDSYVQSIAEEETESNYHEEIFEEENSTVSTLRDTLDFYDEMPMQENIAEIGTSSSNIKDEDIAVDESLCTPSKSLRQTRSSSRQNSPNSSTSSNTHVTEDDVMKRTHLYDSRLKNVKSVLSNYSAVDADQIITALQDGLVRRSSSPLSCARIIANVLHSALIAETRKKIKAKDYVGLKLINAVEEWMKERSRNDFAVVEDGCCVCVLTLGLITEMIRVLEDEKTFNSKVQASIGTALKKKIGSVFDRFILLSSSPCVENKLLFYSNIAKECPQFTIDIAYLDQKYTYLLSTVSEKEEHMSPNTLHLKKNNVSLNVHFHIFLLLIKLIYNADRYAETYEKYLLDLVKEYDFAQSALQDSPILTASDENKEEPAANVVSHTDRLDKMLGKSFGSEDVLKSTSSNAKKVQDNKPGLDSENIVNSNATAVLPLVKTNSLLSKKKVVSHRMSMKPQITQTISILPAPPILIKQKETLRSNSSGRKHVLMSPTPVAKRKRVSSSPSVVVMNTPVHPMHTSKTVIASTPFTEEARSNTKAKSDKKEYRTEGIAAQVMFDSPERPTKHHRKS